MFIDRLINQGGSPLLEQWLRFTEARQRLIADNIANLSTPNYVQKDLSVEKFQSLLAQKAQEAQDSGPGSVDYSNIDLPTDQPRSGILFHDGSNRSMEQLMTNQAKNALMHTLAVELLRRQYASIEMALKERIS